MCGGARLSIGEEGRAGQKAFGKGGKPDPKDTGASLKNTLREDKELMVLKGGLRAGTRSCSVVKCLSSTRENLNSISSTRIKQETQS